MVDSVHHSMVVLVLQVLVEDLDMQVGMKLNMVLDLWVVYV